MARMTSNLPIIREVVEGDTLTVVFDGTAAFNEAAERARLEAEAVALYPAAKALALAVDAQSLADGRIEKWRFLYSLARAADDRMTDRVIRLGRKWDRATSRAALAAVDTANALDAWRFAVAAHKGDT